MPGVALPPGKYIFRLPDPTASHNVVQVLSGDGTKSYGIFFTLGAYRVEPPPQPEQQRCRHGDTGRGFTTAAKAIMPRAIIGRLAPGAFRTAARRIIGRIARRRFGEDMPGIDAAPFVLDPMKPYRQFDIDSGGNELDGDHDAESGPFIAPNL